MIDRESSIAFASAKVKARIIDELGSPIWEAIRAGGPAEAWWPAVRYKKPKAFGTGLDILAVDEEGRLLIVEAKPPGATEGITWGPAQVRFYADLYARLFASNPDVEDHVASVLEQRVSLGLTSPGSSTLARPLRIVPVLAIGAGRASRAAIKRAVMVQEAIDARAKAALPVTKTEFWLLDASGEASLVLA